MESTKQAVFVVGEEEYGLDIMDVNIVEKYMTIEAVPDLPKNIKGVIRLRGDIIPVYSLRRKFGLEDIEPDEDTRFIITTSKDILFAYEIDKMKEIISLEEEQINEVPSIVNNKDTAYMKAVANHQGRLILLLDHNDLLTDDEQKKVVAVLNKLKLPSD